MTTLTGFRSLCHFNLDFLGAYQIAAGNAETPGRHLLDGRAFVKSVRSDGETLDILTAFTGIGFSVKVVHGDGQCLMGFLGDGAVGHGSGLKPAHNLVHALHFFNGHTFFRIVKV